MQFGPGDHVIADIGRWLVDKGCRQQPQPLKLPGKVLTVARPPDWTHRVLLDAPVSLDGKQISIFEGLREDQLTPVPEP